MDVPDVAARRRRARSGVTALVLVLALAFTSFAAAAGGGGGVRRVAGCARLATGSVGAAVATVQRLVGADADGEFGPLTRAAVKRWQRRHDVPVTGAVDAATWAALPAGLARTACGQPVHGTGVAVSCAVLSVSSVGPAVAVLQSAVGADPDGEFGPLTKAAVQAAQRRLKLPASGRAGPATWAALGLTGTPACQAAPADTGTGSGTGSGTAGSGSGTGSGTAGSGSGSGSGDSADAKAQRAIAAQVTQLAAELLDGPDRAGDPVATQALAFARSQKGKPYRWGGTGPKGYDCSGLVMTSYLHAALTLPRVAADQYDAGVKVPLDQARRGDLLFYADDLTRPATIHHVVLYAGNGRVLDAPYTGAYVGTRPLWTRGLLPVAVRPTGLLQLPVRPGDTGWTVGQLQQALDRQGAGLAVDGGFGPATAAAVRAWKQAHDLGPRARVGRTAWLALGRG